MNPLKKNTIGAIFIICLFIVFLNCSIKPSVEENSVVPKTSLSERAPSSILQREQQSDFYLTKVQPIFNNRCVVCHACTEAPCSLYLHSYEGLQRGAMADLKLLSSVFSNQPIRMKDANSLSDWQKKGFTKVMSFNNPKEGLKESILFRFVEQATNYNIGAFELKSSEKYLDQGKICPSEPKTLDEHFKNHPNVGMPFALPALSSTQIEILRKWVVENGAIGPSEFAQKKIQQMSNPEFIEAWEQFLNDKSPKSRLVSRYIFEHSFLTHIHFENTPKNEFYEMIRSRTRMPATPIEIVTDRPYDDPKVDEFYYRFKKVTETIVRKTHVTMELDHKDLIRWKKSFIEADWGLPKITKVDYKSKNPFEYFKQIPASARYSFLLDKSYSMVNSMIRGSVCTGKRATYAIRDHFWVLFLDPTFDPSVTEAGISEREWIPLSTSKEDRDNLIKKLLKSDSNKFNYTTEMIWKGNGTNPNALLTVFRHELSASVSRGLIGKMPNTIWVLNYSNFERMFYNLVVEYMPWGSAAHQYSTWRAMTYHRQEAEERFLMFFPPEARSGIRNRWREGISEYASQILSMKVLNESLDQDDKNIYPVQSIMMKITSEMPKSVIENNNPFFLKSISDYKSNDFIDSIDKWEHELSIINKLHRYKFARYLPNIIYLKVDQKAYTILSNRAFKFNDMILGQNLAYDPQYDSISILKGLFGDRPELFVELSLNDCSLFLKRLLAVSSEEDWRELKKRYAIRRNDAKIWTHLDWFHEFDKTSDLLESGVIDMNQYDLTTW
jgi:hypothetical protein